MANHKSALKRSRQSIQRRDRNKAVKTRVRTTVKELRVAVSEKTDDKKEKLILAQSVIDKAVKKGVIHKRAAARKISRLSKLVNRMTV